MHCSWSCQNSHTYLFEWGTSCTGSLFLYGSSSRSLSRCGSVSPGARRTICKNFATYHNLRPSANAILRGRSFPARSSTGQNCDNAERAFAYAGPTLWNNMPEAIRSSALLVSPDTIKHHMKTHFFSQFWFILYVTLNSHSSLYCRRTEILRTEFCEVNIVSCWDLYIERDAYKSIIINK